MTIWQLIALVLWVCGYVLLGYGYKVSIQSCSLVPRCDPQCLGMRLHSLSHATAVDVLALLKTRHCNDLSQSHQQMDSSMIVQELEATVTMHTHTELMISGTCPYNYIARAWVCLQHWTRRIWLSWQLATHCQSHGVWQSHHSRKLLACKEDAHNDTG